MSEETFVSPETEAALLGALIVDADMMGMVKLEHGLSQKDFVAYRKLATLMFEMDEAQEGIDLVTVRHRAESKDINLVLDGGEDLLMHCVELAGSCIEVGRWVKLIKDYALRRSLLQELDKCSEKVRNVEKNPEDTAALISDNVLKHIRSEEDNSNAEVLEDVYATIMRLQDESSGLIGLPTGMDMLDKMTHGWQPGLNVIAGIPSAGKTSLEGMTMAHNAQNGTPVARITLDATRQELLFRDACRLSGVSMPKLLKGHGGEKNLSHVRDAMEEIKTWDMYFLEGETDISKIISWIRLMRQRNGIEMFSIDYIQLVNSSDGGKEWNENAELSRIMQKLKNTTFNLGIPGLILSQFNREAQRTSRPLLKDLRGSGAIEQEAFSAIFLYQEEKIKKEQSAAENVKQRPVWFDLAKYKNGPTYRLETWFHAPYFRFEEAPEAWGNQKFAEGVA